MLNNEEIQVLAEGLDSATPVGHVATTFTYVVFTLTGTVATSLFDIFTDPDGSVWLCGKGASTPNNSYRVQATSANNKVGFSPVLVVTAPAAAPVVDHVVVSFPNPSQPRTHFAPPPSP